MVHRCQPYLERQGFLLDGRGSSIERERSWVEFNRPERTPDGEDGTLVLMMGHERRKHTLLFDAYFVDLSLEHYPRAKLRRHYDGTKLSEVVGEFVNTVSRLPG